MTRRSLFASLAAAVAALTAFRPLSARGRRPCYRGSMRGHEAVVFRPDGSRLDPLPLVLVESLPNLWATKYTPRPYPVSGFAWGRIPASHGRTQLAAAVLLDYTGGDRSVADSCLLLEFSALFSRFPPGGSWTLPLGAIDQFLANYIQRVRPDLDPAPGAYRRPDLVQASMWRYRPHPESLERARSLRAALIERQAWRIG